MVLVGAQREVGTEPNAGAPELPARPSSTGDRTDEDLMKEDAVRRLIKLLSKDS
jgi:hypothetical protein